MLGIVGGAVGLLAAVVAFLGAGFMVGARLDAADWSGQGQNAPYWQSAYSASLLYSLSFLLAITGAIFAIVTTARRGRGIVATGGSRQLLPGTKRYEACSKVIKDLRNTCNYCRASTVGAEELQREH